MKKIYFYIFSSINILFIIFFQSTNNFISNFFFNFRNIYKCYKWICFPFDTILLQLSVLLLVAFYRNQIINWKICQVFILVKNAVFSKNWKIFANNLPIIWLSINFNKSLAAKFPFLLKKSFFNQFVILNIYFWRYIQKTFIQSL